MSAEEITEARELSGGLQTVSLEQWTGGTCSEMAWIYTLLGLLAVWINSIETAGNPNSLCYDPVTKEAQKCEPVFQNIAYGMPVSCKYCH